MKKSVRNIIDMCETMRMQMCMRGFVLLSDWNLCKKK